jgi:hypothetical protein
MSLQSSPAGHAVLEELKTLFTDARRLKSLNIIDSVCREIRECGGAFTLAIVGRKSSALGGPSTRSIANADGAPYRRLIEAYKHDALGKKQKARMPADEEDELLSSVPNGGDKAKLKIMLSEGRAWRRKANALQAIANRSATITLEPRQASADLPLAHIGRRAPIELLPTEKKALALALDPARLARARLRLDPQGRLLDDSDASRSHNSSAVSREIMPIGFGSALKKLAEAAGVEIRDSVFVTARTKAADT